MDTVIIVTIVVLLIGMKVLSSIWKAGSKESEEYQKLALNPKYRAEQLKKIKAQLEGTGSNDSKLVYKVATINALSEQFEDAAKEFKRYTVLEPDDAEGFSELSDAYVRAEQLDNAREAIETAIKIAPDYEEYREAQLRIGLTSKDVEYSEKASLSWMELDEERIRLNKRPHRWSPEYQIGPKHVEADIAIKSYLAAVLLLKGESDAAKEAMKAMNDKEQEYLEILLTEDELFAGLKELYDA